MVEFVVVGPIITLFGLAILQYGLLFFSRNQINHASFMAARAGTMAHAKLSDIRETYLRAMVPLYGGGRNSDELSQAKAKAVADLDGNLRIDLLNPTSASFDDWSAPYLQKKYNARAIPNAGLAYRDKNDIGGQSGQSVQDANLLKLKVTHGYELKVPLVNTIYKHYLQWLDDGHDPLHTELIKRGRLPIVTHVTLHMQSDAIEGQTTSLNQGHGDNDSPWGQGGSGGSGSGSGSGAGAGAGGSGSGGSGGSGGPDDSDDADSLSSRKPPPDCRTIGCTLLDPSDAKEPEPDDGAGNGAGNGAGGSAGQGGADGGSQCF
ncbi:pilus assembly protein [Verminephrobacter eiseniae]|nr:pilus assembly protein [Verminephrobacter eiseniae]MCW5304715.1 pilus assembly protein [Verminephrobacter eiseniae]MCW8182608.1 pilus assembly protein [Verminephrobacter eiseniae]MCW8190539.1 pilus assembly protein [Verminephrobacter eiseniae]